MRLVERVSDISGEPLLRGFTLDLKDVWNALI
jgi:hypothetical protein